MVNALQRREKTMKLSNLTVKQKSLILSGLAGIGVIITGYLSAKCALKAEDRETTKEKALAYAPAIVSGCATVACIGVSTYISGEEIAAVTLACSAMAQKYPDYRKAVHETVTPDEEARINEAFYLKEIDRLEQELAEREHPRDDDDLVMFVDSYSGYPFRARMDEVDYGIEQANQHYRESGCLAWSDIFFLINEDTGPYKSVLGGGDDPFGYGGIGWSEGMMEQLYDNADGFDFKVFKSELKDRPGVYEIGYSVPPEMCYLEY